MSAESDPELRSGASIKMPPFRKNWVLCSATMGVVFLAVAWMGLRPRSTPYGNLLYNDVSMAEWFERYSHDPNDRVAEEALKHFGADLAPFLIEKIQSRDSEFQRFLAQARKKLQEQFPTIMDQLPRPMPASMIQARAEKAFRLVVYGRRPLPELRVCLKNQKTPAIRPIC